MQIQRIKDGAARRRSTICEMASHRETIRELFGSGVSDVEEDDAPDRARAQLPRVGTSVQRADREQRRRRAMLLETSPPPPWRSRGPPGTQTRRRSAPATPTSPPGIDPRPRSQAPRRDRRLRGRQRPSPATPTESRGIGPDPLSPGQEPMVATISQGDMGPALPPPVRVTLPSGEMAEVPHFAAHISRHYKVRVPSGKWLVRFDHQG
ncbi:hypothetical protein ACFW04_012718 [Cataglyphis niger]